MAKSTFCRKCSEYFAITPAVVAGAAAVAAFVPPSARSAGKVAYAPSAPAAERPPASSDKAPPQTPTVPTGNGGGWLGGLLSSKPKTRIAHCFECTSWHEISSSAHSTTCKACGAYIDLQDYKINGSFSRNIKTRGTLYLGSKGDLSSSKIVCEQATLHGKMRGNLTCPGRVTIRVQGRLYGSVEAGQLVVEKGSEVIVARPIRASSVEVHGVMSGQIISDSHVLISKTGSLDGAVDATGFSVEKGGCFQGELTIRPPGVTAPANTEEQAPTASLPQEAGENGKLFGGEQQPALG